MKNLLVGKTLLPILFCPVSTSLVLRTIARIDNYRVLLLTGSGTHIRFALSGGVNEPSWFREHGEEKKDALFMLFQLHRKRFKQFAVDSEKWC
jgi:hypothetical protein